MIFYKSVSAGNDFIHVEAVGLDPAAKTRLVKNLCERNTGAGADGVVFYKIRGNEGGVDFEIYNRDGSEAELSGNGMAGLSALLLYLGKCDNQVILHTKAGIKSHELLERKENRFKLKIEIGEADFSRKDFFPFLQGGKICYEYKGTAFYPVSVGNPHTVVIMEDRIPEKEMIAVGEMLENAEMFPRKTNVEFVLQPGSKTGLSKGGTNCLVFYHERGVGRTQSSSTGSAAVFAVLRKIGRVRNSLVIDTSREKIKIFAKRKIYIENFTKIVYKGIYLNTCSTETRLT